MSELQQATTGELVAELLSRSTFRGVVLWIEDRGGVLAPRGRCEAKGCDAVATMRRAVEHADTGREEWE